MHFLVLRLCRTNGDAGERERLRILRRTRTDLPQTRLSEIDAFANGLRFVNPLVYFDL